MNDSPKKRNSRVRKKRERHHTRRWYERQLLAVAEGRLVMSNKEYKAFHDFRRVKGWNRRPPGEKGKK